MELQWTEIAKADLKRLYAFLAVKNPLGAARAIRRIIVGQYELRYELHGSTVVVLRVWHGREDR